MKKSHKTSRKLESHGNVAAPAFLDRFQGRKHCIFSFPGEDGAACGVRAIQDVSLMNPAFHDGRQAPAG